MNGRQCKILVGGVIMAVLTVAHPPFILEGGIFPALQYSFIWDTPYNPDGESSQTLVFWPLVLLQLSFVILCTKLFLKSQWAGSITSHPKMQETTDEEGVWPPPPNINF